MISTAAFALPYGSGTYGTCQFDSCSISVSASSDLSLNVTPTSAGVYSTVSDNITVITGSSTGFTLSLQDSDTVTDLTSGSNHIANSAGSQATPVTRSMDTWGYRVDGLANFGSGPTSAETNAASSSYTFAGIPASDQTADILKATSSVVNPSTTTIWYGAAVNLTPPGGTYTTTIVYTATVNG